MLVAIELGIAMIVLLLAIIMAQLGSQKESNVLINLVLGFVFLVSLGVSGLVAVDAFARIGSQAMAASPY